MTAVGTTLAPVTPRSPRRRLGLAAAREIGHRRSGSAVLRRRAVTTAAAGLGTTVLLTAAIIGIDDEAAAGQSLSAYLAESGLRPGSALAAALVALPLLALALQALKVGSLDARRRHRALGVAGATPADLRLVGAVEDARLFARGAVAAGPCYLLLWLALGVLPRPGARLVPHPEPALLVVWILLVVVLTGAGAVTGALPPRAEVSAAARARWRGVVAPLVALVVLTAAVGRSVTQGELDDASLTAAVGALLVLVALTGAGAGSFAARRARARPGSRTPGADVLAAARLRGDPAAAGRLSGVLLLCGLGFGVEAIYVHGVLVDRTSSGDATFYVQGALLAAAVGAVAALVALTSAALGVTDHLLTARRSVASVSALGAETRVLVQVQAKVLRSTAVPAVSTGTAIGGLLHGANGLSVGGPAAAVALAVVALTTAVVALLTTTACGLLARSLAGRVRRAAALENLRTP